MKPVTVTSRPEAFEAVQFDGVPDLELAKWVGGYFRPSRYGEGWWLVFSQSKSDWTVSVGEWIIKDANGHFHTLTPEEFDKGYRES